MLLNIIIFVVVLLFVIALFNFNLSNKSSVAEESKIVPDKEVKVITHNIEPKALPPYDFIKENLSDQNKIKSFIKSEFEKKGFDVNLKNFDSNISIKNKNKNRNICFIDFTVEYKNYGHAVARFNYEIDRNKFNDNRISVFIPNESRFHKRSSTPLKNEKDNIGITCDSDLDLIIKICLNKKID